VYSFRLPDGQLANYPWGSSVIRLSTLAPHHSKSLSEFMAAYLTPRADWINDAGFRAHISFQHELVHYYQDLLTGVGRWGLLVRRKLNPMLLGLGRDVSLRGQNRSRRLKEYARIQDVTRGFLDLHPIAPHASAAKARR
jgi:hypothetical protein